MTPRPLALQSLPGVHIASLAADERLVNLDFALEHFVGTSHSARRVECAVVKTKRFFE